MYLYDTKEKLLVEFSRVHGIVPAIQVSEVTFTNAGVWLQGACNAKVTITALTDTPRFKGSSTIYYNRYRIDEELRDLVLPGKPGDYINTTEVTDMLRDVYGISLYDNDFYHTNILSTATEVELETKIDAVGWLPPYVLTLKFDLT